MYAKFKTGDESAVSGRNKDGKPASTSSVNCEHPKESVRVSAAFILDRDLGVIYTHECKTCETKLVQYSTITGSDDLREVEFINDKKWVKENESEIYDFAFPNEIEESEEKSQYCEHPAKYVCIYRINLGGYDYGQYDHEYNFRCDNCNKVFYYVEESNGNMCKNIFKDDKGEKWISDRGLTTIMNVDYWWHYVNGHSITMTDIEDLPELEVQKLGLQVD